MFHIDYTDYFLKVAGNNGYTELWGHDGQDSKYRFMTYQGIKNNVVKELRVILEPGFPIYPEEMKIQKKKMFFKGKYREIHYLIVSIDFLGLFYAIDLLFS